MPALPRGFCPTCGRRVALRNGGLVREHSCWYPPAPVCPGSGQLAAKKPPIRGRWTRYDRMRGAGWTMAHYNAWDAGGYSLGPACGYSPHRGLKPPSAVQITDAGPVDPRCSRCERIVLTVAA